MTDGMEITEVPASQESKEVEVNPEKQAEIKEAAEVQKQTDEATHTPEASKEKMEYAPAEDLMGALVKAVDAVPVKQAESADEGAGPSEEIQNLIRVSDPEGDKGPELGQQGKGAALRRPNPDQEQPGKPQRLRAEQEGAKCRCSACSYPGQVQEKPDRLSSEHKLQKFQPQLKN